MSKILVIDDEESIRVMLSLSLSYKGYEVLSAEDGESGIELFKQTRPPLVLTDIKMPGMDGLQVLKEIKKIDPDTRVIVITGHGEMESAIEALHLEASDFINKPITDEALSVALKRAEEVLWLKNKLREYTQNLELMVMEATNDLRSAHDFQKNLIESSIDGIVATDAKGAIAVFNRGAERLLGYEAQAVVGKLPLEALFPQGVAGRIKEEMASQRHGGRDQLVHYENTALSNGGEQIPVRISGATLVENGRASGLVCFLQDLREIKRLEREVIANERLSAMGQAVAGMAHYIKNILNGLQGGVYMVNVGLHKDKQGVLTKGWAMVEKNIGRISDLVMNMLVYSREREPDYMACSPNEIAQEVFTLLQEKAAQSGVNLSADLDSSIHECRLDPTGLHRCLLNLAGNAIDACIFDTAEDKHWSVMIKTRRTDGGLEFTVSDNGVGMSPEVQRKVFERFFSTKGGRGTGLGLLVTHKIVHEHGGTIAFESQPGRGTAFKIRLPWLLAAPPEQKSGPAGQKVVPANP